MHLESRLRTSYFSELDGVIVLLVRFLLPELVGLVGLVGLIDWSDRSSWSSWSSGSGWSGLLAILPSSRSIISTNTLILLFYHRKVSKENRTKDILSGLPHK